MSIFWKREDQKWSQMPIGVLLPPPPKKQFATMLEMLRDAEKYDNEGEQEVSNAYLTNLCEYIERYKARINNKIPNVPKDERETIERP